MSERGYTLDLKIPVQERLRRYRIRNTFSRKRTHGCLTSAFYWIAWTIMVVITTLTLRDQLGG